jgi:TetR/AcrR family transcriptional repressor of nem operon
MAAQPGRGNAGTRARILDVAERLLQDRGYNGFSYATVAAELQITKPALHYHFASKAELGEALVARYTARFNQARAAIDIALTAPLAKLEGYAELYLDVLRQGRMCLCGVLAAEYQTLPQPMQVGVTAFFDRNEDWLHNVLDQGRDDDSLQFSGSARDAAHVIISCLEGAMLLARPHGGIEGFNAAAANLLESLTPAPGKPAATDPDPAGALTN